MNYLTINPYYEVSEVDLVYRSKVKSSEMKKVMNSKDMYDIFHSSWEKDKIEFIEQFKVMLLNTANGVLGIYECSSGGINRTTVDVRLVFTAALKSNATKIAVAHNHPSGNTKPSQADINITKQIRDAGNLLDIKLLDHLIVTQDAFFSFAEDGLI